MNSDEVQDYIDAMRGAVTARYQVIEKFILPVGMLDNLQPLCELALCELKRRETEIANAK